MVSDEITSLDMTTLAACIRARDIPVREVVEAHLGRIESLNPGLNAVVTLTADQALADADAADAQLAAGRDVGPLHGVPVVHKDLLDTAGIRTTYGSPIFADHVPATDDPIVASLRAAGAITLGKTNTPEFGAGSQTFNPVFGVTRNPYDPALTCGGSSGGSAVALASGMAPLATGTDMGGSLRNPASFCNVVGFRPSRGVVPAPNTNPAWDTLNTHGVMARTVRDIALAMRVLDPATPQPDALEFDLRGIRIALSADAGGLPVEPAVRSVVEGSRSVFQSLGCTVVEAWPDFAGADEAFETLRAAAFATTFGDLYDREAARMKATVCWNIEAGRALSPGTLNHSWRLRLRLRNAVAAFMAHCDFLVLPTTQVTPFPVEREYVTEIDGTPLESYIAWMRSCSRISVTGMPAISVPAGFTPQGLPVGLQIVGREGDDGRLLRFAYAFEQARTQPRA